jgi:hypothetical protein
MSWTAMVGDTTFAVKMKTKVAIFLTGLYLLALCKPVWPLIDYYANRDFFAEVLCVNTDKPEMHCNGQCALAQKFSELAKESSTKTIPAPKISLEDFPIGLLISSMVTNILPESVAVLHNCYPVNKYSFSIADFLFHPPRLNE